MQYIATTFVIHCNYFCNNGVHFGASVQAVTKELLTKEQKFNIIALELDCNMYSYFILQLFWCTLIHRHLASATKKSSTSAAANRRLNSICNHLSPKLITTSTTSSSPHRPTHLILNLVDDLGFNDLGGFHGTPESTGSAVAPVCTQLMNEGIRLKRMYAWPLCSPTRGALLTGRYPIRWGGHSHVGNAAYETWLPSHETTIAEILKPQNFRSHLVGKWHLGHSDQTVIPTGQGFDSFFGLYLGGGDHWVSNVLIRLTKDLFTLHTNVKDLLHILILYIIYYICTI